MLPSECIRFLPAPGILKKTQPHGGFLSQSNSYIQRLCTYLKSHRMSAVLGYHHYGYHLHWQNQDFLFLIPASYSEWVKERKDRRTEGTAEFLTGLWQQLDKVPDFPKSFPKAQCTWSIACSASPLMSSSHWHLLSRVHGVRDASS